MTGLHSKAEAIAKLFLLGTIKYAARDAYRIGVEYEGGRPRWEDAINGLAGYASEHCHALYIWPLTFVSSCRLLLQVFSQPVSMVGSGMPETSKLPEL